MAQFKSDTYTAQETAAGNAGKMIGSAELISGKDAHLQCKVTVPAGTAANDTILLGFLPSGMTVIPGGSSTTVPVAAGASTIDIGVEGDRTAIASNISVNTAGSATLNSTVASFKNTERQAVIATLDGALTAGRELFFNFQLVNSN